MSDQLQPIREILLEELGNPNPRATLRTLNRLGPLLLLDAERDAELEERGRRIVALLDDLSGCRKAHNDAVCLLAKIIGQMLGNTVDVETPVDECCDIVLQQWKKRTEELERLRDRDRRFVLVMKHFGIEFEEDTMAESTI